jgi:hypothetical protein
LWIKGSWNMFSSWNSWVSDSSINFLFIHVATRSHHFICKCFNEVFSTSRFAIFPVNSSSRWLCHCFTWLINIILSRSKCTSIICKSCNLCNKNTFYGPIRLLDNVIIII